MSKLKISVAAKVGRMDDGSVSPSGASPEIMSTDPLAQESGEAGQKAADSKFSSMGDLQAKAPEVWRAMCEGIAMHITEKMREHRSRMKKLIREAQNKR